MGLVEGFDPAKIIKRALKNGGDFGELYLEDTQSTSISCEEDRIEKVLSGRERGCGVRVLSNLKTFYAFTNDLTEKGLLKVAGIVAEAVKGDGEVGEINLMDRNVAEGFLIKKSPFEVDLSQKIGYVNTANTAARGFDNRVRQVKVIYGDSLRGTAIINSLGEWVEEERTSTLFLCQVVTQEGEVIQTGYEPVGGLLGLEIFDDNPPEVIAELAAKRAVMMLSAKKAPSGRMPVVLSSEAGGTMIHEAVGHGLEADLAGEGLSVYAGKLGEKVANTIITVIDDGTIANKRGSGFFDSEGTPSAKNVLVEDGMLKKYMQSRLTAMKAGLVSTGNGRRQSYKNQPIPRMTNTYIAPGKDNPADILKATDSGLYVVKMGGGQVNTVNGDFVFEVTEGYLIDNGKQGELVRGATIIGSGPEVLNAIDMVGTDLGFGIGTCGKDGQGVPVSDAQPTIRIPEITVGGEIKG
jgi:TldD protein